METVGQRIKYAAEKVGGLEALAAATGIKRTTMFYYARDKTEPKVSALVEIAKATGTSIEWLAVGNGDVLRKTEIRVKEASIADIRSFLWNICETYYEKLPRRTKPAAFADQCLAMFDYLLTREDVKKEAAAEVIEFGAEQLKRASGRDEP